MELINLIASKPIRHFFDSFKMSSNIMAFNQKFISYLFLCVFVNGNSSNIILHREKLSN